MLRTIARRTEGPPPRTAVEEARARLLGEPQPPRKRWKRDKKSPVEGRPFFDGRPRDAAREARAAKKMERRKYRRELKMTDLVPVRALPETARPCAGFAGYHATPDGRIFFASHEGKAFEVPVTRTFDDDCPIVSAARDDVPGRNTRRAVRLVAAAFIGPEDFSLKSQYFEYLDGNHLNISAANIRRASKPWRKQDEDEP